MGFELSEEGIIACARDLLLASNEITVRVADGQPAIRFPTTRLIAEKLGVPHYYVLPYFADLETKGLLTRTERIGIFTTARGLKILFSGMDDGQRKKAEEICGPALMKLLLE